MTHPTLPAAEHAHIGGSAGGPGENSAECACGVTFAGFDTHREAIDLLTRHVEQENSREKKRADQLAAGDIAVDILDSFDPWISHRDGKVLASYPYVDEVDNARVLLVVEGDGPKPKPETVRLDAEVMVGLRSKAELEAARQLAERAQRIADLRAFADFLECNPWAPLPYQSAQTEVPFETIVEYGERVGVPADTKLDDRTQVFHRFGGFEYRVIAWHKDGRPAEPEATKPLISDETIAEAVAMEERDRAAGGPPWEVPSHPENSQPGGWHHGQLDPSGLLYSRELDDPTPVSPARGGPVHTGGVVAGGQLVDETPAEVHTAEVYFSEAYREAFRLARQADPGHRSSPELRTAAALDLLHGQALAEDAERTRRADVREGEQGRVINPGVAHFLAVKEERSRIARHFLGLEESAKHYPAEPVSEAR